MQRRAPSAGTIALWASALACASARPEPRADGAVAFDDAEIAIVSEDTVELDVAAAPAPLLRAVERVLREIDARDVVLERERGAVEATVGGSRVLATAVAVDAGRSKLRVSAWRYGFPSLESARAVAVRLRG